MTAALVMGLLGAFFGAALALVASRLRTDEDRVVEAVNDLLPQIQCAQCGYPGCRPYAQAIVAGAALNLCPPGGVDTAAAIARLLGREAAPTPPAETSPVKALIDEAACIGCALCLDACPVDAIVGANKFVHTVIAERCTGCELCVAPCPVDCIELVPGEGAWQWPRP